MEDITPDFRLVTICDSCLKNEADRTCDVCEGDLCADCAVDDDDRCDACWVESVECNNCGDPIFEEEGPTCQGCLDGQD